MESKGGLGLGSIIVIGFLVWFFFIRVDYKDVWWSGTETQRVIYCGNTIDPHCSTGDVYYVPVTHLSKDGDVHTFEIAFKNGGYIETEGTCDQAAKGMYDYDRFCRTTGTDLYGNSYMYVIAPE